MILLNLKKFVSPVILFLFLVSLTGCAKWQSKNENVSETERLRETIVSYMTQPSFTNNDFTYQITGTKAELQVYNVDEELLYFSIKKSDFDSLNTFNKLTGNPGSVQIGYEDNGKVHLGKYTLRGTDRMFFCFPVYDFKVDSAKAVSINYGKYNYTVTVKELADFSEDLTVYGGKIEAAAGKYFYMANHGALVSIKNEPSLKRLTDQIIGDETNPEKIAQMLLDFVVQNIKYNEIEGLGIYEVLKRPNEVLMTGNSDCSGLTILYASLLEQFNIEYRLVYFPRHICVGVSGNFRNINKLNFEHDDKTFTIAETTVKGFRIGITPLTKDFTTSEIKYIQKPAKESNITRFKNGKVMTEK